MWGVCTMGWTTWRLRDCWCCLTGAAWMMQLWQWFFCCLLSKLHGDRVTAAAATTPGSTEWTAGTTAWQLRDCWCCLTGADYISLDCVHGISCKFIMTGVPSFLKRGSDGGVFCARFQSDWTSAIDITAFHNISVGGEYREDVPYSNSDIAFRDEVNIALQRPASQSDTYATNVAANAVDGKVEFGYRSTTENGDLHPWWKMHLAYPIWVYQVEITSIISE